MTAETKICNRCKIEKNFIEFNKESKYKDGLRKYCRECHKELHKLYYLKNKEIVAARHKKWANENPDKVKQLYTDWEKANPIQKMYRHLKTYWPGKSIKELKQLYHNLLEKQKYACAICHTHEKDLKRRLAVDHCHVSGKVRGLLCGKCNIGLGSFKDSTHLLKQAISYLEVSNEN